MNHQQMDEVLFPNSVEPTCKGITVVKETKNNWEHCCGNENWVRYGIVVREVTDICAVFPIGQLLMEKLVDVNRWWCEVFGIIDLALFSRCELTMYTRI
jgi:hypothetical protein